MANKEKMIEKIENEISKIEEKKNKLFFFVIDTKGNPSGSLAYLYKTAYALKELGYDVAMLHQEEDFVGPYEWLGDKYKELPHFNVEKENIEISPSDFLFIPEIYSHIMVQVKELPCEKVVIFQNFEYLTENFPISARFTDMNINRAITTTENQKKYIETCFPELKVNVVTPSISGMFRNTDEPKKLIVNIVARNREDVGKIVKNFYWKYPVYKWVSFRDLRGFPQDQFADRLREGAVTVWADTETNFGYAPIEAMKSGSIVVGKVPENPADWMMDGDNFIDSIIWFDNFRTLPEIIASIIRTWTYDQIPEELYEEIKKFDDKFTEEEFKKNVENVYSEKIFGERCTDFKNTLEYVKNNESDKKEE